MENICFCGDILSMIKGKIFKGTSPVDPDYFFLCCNKLTINPGTVINFVKFNKYNKAFLMGTFTYLVNQMNLPLVIERFRHIGNSFDWVVYFRDLYVGQSYVVNDSLLIYRFMKI